MMPVGSGNDAYQYVYNRIFQGFGVITANNIKILIECDFGDDAPEIREGKTVPPFDLVSTFGSVFQPCSIDPDDGGRHHGKVDVIDHGMGITGLAFAAADILFDLLEAGFDFPSGAIIFDDLFNGQFQVGGKEGNPFCFTKYEYDTDRTFKRSEHYHMCGGYDFAVTTIEKNTVDRCLFFARGRKISTCSYTLSIFTRSAACSWYAFWRH